jgi:uncharacterized protein DUF6494
LRGLSKAGDHAAAPRQLDDSANDSTFIKKLKGKSDDIDNAAARNRAASKLTNTANQTCASGLCRRVAAALTSPAMDDATINAAVSRFLKSVSVSAHREIEKVVRKAIASGAAREGEVLTVGVTLASEKLDLDITIFNKIDL